MNLCVNARDAIGDRRGLIEIAMKVLDPAAERTATLGAAGEKAVQLPDGRTHVQLGTIDAEVSYVRIMVRDTGCGMDYAVVERMFEPFFTTKEVGRGTGLGLAAVHGILAEHKGAMLVTSRVGEGTTFDLFFPLASKPAERVAETDASLPTGSGRILVIDDEPQLGTMLMKLLSRLGYTATAYTNPLEALAQVKQDPGAWDLVITDQMMPQITGLELAKDLLGTNPRLPIVMCTGYSGGVTDAAVKEVGVLALLTKPVDPRELARTVRQALDARQQG
jgi:CheY-like chemotaxis protein